MLWLTPTTVWSISLTGCGVPAMISRWPVMKRKENGVMWNWGLLKSCWRSFLCFSGSETSYILPAFTSRAPTSVPERRYALSSIESTRPSLSFPNRLSFAFFTCFRWWCVHSFASYSVLGGFLAQNSHFPKYNFACLDNKFFGLPLLSTVVALFINLFPLQNNSCLLWFKDFVCFLHVPWESPFPLANHWQTISKGRYFAINPVNFLVNQFFLLCKPDIQHILRSEKGIFAFFRNGDSVP